MATENNNLLVVGAGRLGVLVAHLWRSSYPTARIECVTRTTNNHESLTEDGFVATTIETDNNSTYPYVLFCAPPGDDYALHVANARKRTCPGGRFVFTSATSVYVDKGAVNENSPLADTARAKRLLDAEAVVGNDGVVVRLGMLYTAEIGAHSWWLKRGRVDGAPTCVYNSIHYQDAASMCVATLRTSGIEGFKLIGTDGVPHTAHEICSAGREHHDFRQFAMPTFGSGGPEKRVDNSWSRSTLEWEPKWKSYVAFLRG